MQYLPIRRALLSVTHKDGLLGLGRLLTDHGVELVSTGGTYKALTAEGLPVTAVSHVTGFPEILGGRVKTLHPSIHGGILADKDKPEHLTALSELNIKPFDLICVNLYDFAAAVKDELPLTKAVEEIDIGGPCMIRAASKNYHSVLVLPETAAYAPFMEEFTRNEGKISLEFRRAMAVRAFALTARYDAMISEYLEKAVER